MRAALLRAAAAGLVAATGLLAPACVTVDATPTITRNVADWRDEIVYQVMIDRFADGDPNNNFHVDTAKEAAYHGGDWQGVIDRLDYIEALGVTALWISPVVRNVEEDAGFASYHGYWTQSFLDVNPHFGDLSKLQELVRKCHARGIKVILDIVTNHVGQLFYYDINRNGSPDIVFFGGGGNGPGSRNPDQPSALRRASEWDPEYDSRGVQGFTSLGENGPAPIVFLEQPAIERMPPEPPEFRNPEWYNRRGRVTVWESGGNLSNPRLGTQICAQCSSAGPSQETCSPDPACAERVKFEYVREQEMYGDFPGGLKDLRTELPEVRQALIRVFEYWIQATDIDGFRIDTLKHIEPDFFEEFAPAIRRFAKSIGKTNFFMFGEAFDGNDALLGSYTQGEGVDSVFYFSAKYRIFNGIFGSGGPTSQARALYEERGAQDDSGAIPEDDPTQPRYSATPKTDGVTDSAGLGVATRDLLVHFLDNHDVPRFLYEFPDVNKLRMALVYQLTTDGIPCIYYGTEQDFRGGPDPSNREDLWWSGYSTSGTTFRHIAKLNGLRKAHVALRRGGLVFRYTTDHTGAEADAGILAYERESPEERVLVVINSNAAHDSRTRDGDTVLTTGFPAGTTLRDVLGGGQTYTVGADGSLDIALPPLSALVLVGP